MGYFPLFDPYIYLILEWKLLIRNCQISRRNWNFPNRFQDGGCNILCYFFSKIEWFTNLLFFLTKRMPLWDLACSRYLFMNTYGKINRLTTSPVLFIRLVFFSSYIKTNKFSVDKNKLIFILKTALLLNLMLTDQCYFFASLTCPT